MGGLIDFIAELKVLWKEWDVRSLIVASFVFQLILILIAPFRKRSSSLFVRISTWISYLLADWVAAQAVGLIAKATRDSLSQESELFGLWAQFLLLHLGGPDTITALALQDNELWLRTALHLVLIFVVGVIKYLQRVASLQRGRLLDIDDDPYKNYMTKLPMAGGENEGNTLSNASMIRGSYLLFQAYKSLYSDLPLKRDVRAAARKYFLKRTPEEAYRMVAIQLNFMYEAMYTEMDVMHKTAWWVLHHVAFWLQVASLAIWYFRDKRGFHSYDLRITYTLLIGALVVDIIGFVRINRSDWNVALSNKERKVGIPWGKMGPWLLDVYESRAPRSMHISLYTGSSADNCFDKVAKFLNLQDSEHNRHEVRLFIDASPIWNFIFEMLTKPCEQMRYELPTGSKELVTMNELLRRAFPIHVLDYHMILRYWYLATWNNNLTEHLEKYQCIAEYLVYLIAFKQDMMFAAAGKGRVVTLQKQSLYIYDRNNFFPPEEELSEQEEDVNDRRRMADIFGLLTLESNRDEAMVEEAKRQLFEVKEYVEAEGKWEIFGRVWGELLCHAAITCRPNVHAANLKEGGEFVTFVWLLMVHLGIEAKTST